MNKLNILLALLFSISLISCNSVKKYNETINSKHSVAELHKDIDFTFKKIEKLHPSLYWFISKEKLDFKIDSVKKAITNPLTSKEFYFILSPLVSEIRQGHNSVGFPLDRYEKEVLNEYKKTTNKFSLLRFENVEEKVIISEVYDSIKTLENAELLKIDNFEVKDLLAKYNHMRSSDGFNTTFIERRKGLMIKSYYMLENPTLDSVTLKLRLNDSIFDTTFYRIKKPIIKPDTIKENELEELSDEEKLKIKKEKKQKLKYNLSRGYNKKIKTFTRNYKFLEDSTVGYIKIRGFMNGPYQDLYDEFFAEIDTANCSSIIIDLRDNLGGRLAEIHYLMQYLAKDEFVTMSDMESKTRIPRTKSIWSSNNKPLMILIKTIATPFLYTYEQITSKKKNGIVYHKMKASKPTIPFENSFKGKVYVIINGNSFSASSIISTNLQGSDRATIVGEESGGTFNGTVAGVFKPITLPNTKLKVQFGLGMIRAPYTEAPDGFGVIPDYSIFPTLEHRKQGVDTELEFVLKQIKEELDSLEIPVEDNTNDLDDNNKK
ncbi:S41 family peptidase [Flavobacteriales bacterium]|nr:S41 family peptidase [Flavobacteriales bacterium]